MSDSRLLIAIPVLPVRDVQDSLAFYRDHLGFDTAFEYGPYAGVTRSGIELHLSGEKGEPVSCRVSVRGVDDLYREMRKQDVVHPEEPLETKPWGLRQFSVLDPSGNRITFAEPAAEAETRTTPVKRFLVTFTHVEGAQERVRKEDVPRMIEGHREWERETREQEGSSLVYLDSPGNARTVRLHPDGRLEVTDGTFAPGPEAPGGFTIIEAESIDEAVGYAKRYRWMEGSNEVREIKTPPGLSAWIRAVESP